jgi:hypothetical protein
MQEIWPDATIRDYSLEKETPDGKLVETVKAQHGPMAQASGARIDIFPGASLDMERVPLTHRKSAVIYSFPRSVHYDVRLKGLPDRGLPDPQSLSGDGWSIQTTYAREGEVIHATWELQLSRTRFEPAAFPELRKLWSAVSATSAWDISLAN